MLLDFSSAEEVLALASAAFLASLADLASASFLRFSLLRVRTMMKITKATSRKLTTFWIKLP